MPDPSRPVAANGGGIHGPADTARRLSADRFGPDAEKTDQADAVPSAHLQALADGGLFGIYGPERYGGSTTAAPEVRAVHRALGAGCGATYFVWAQHQGPVMLLANSPNDGLRDLWLPPLCRGEVLGGTAFAHLRRPGPPAVAAAEVPGGWRLHGKAPWATSWGLAGVYTVAAFAGNGDVVWFLVEGHEQAGLDASPPQRLAVMAATRTVSLTFEGLELDDDQLILRLPPELWWAIDDSIAARLNPAVLGVADTALNHLGAVDALGDGPIEELAGVLSAELDACSEHNEALAAEADGGAIDLDALAAGRAWGIDVAQRAALALLATTGGRGIDLGHPAQRLVRESAFYAIQAQTGPGRAASLARILEVSLQQA